MTHRRPVSNPIFCAIDTADADAALRLARGLVGAVGGLKLGLEFFCANGPQGVAPIADLGLPLFLDLKLHDIPQTVAGAVRAAAALGPALLTIHASGGPAMMRAAADAAAQAAARRGGDRTKLLGVTVLTSLDAADLTVVGQTADASDQVERLARLALENGLDGVVCSPHEIGRLRQALGPSALLVIPGIRPAGEGSQDQKRVMTPAAALEAGADYLVIGRPITQAKDPAETARRIADDVSGRHIQTV
ncbi:MAG: orotidine-5'-phosphate decarboxylase [Inquilinaceae bacterium]